MSYKVPHALAGDEHTPSTHALANGQLSDASFNACHGLWDPATNTPTLATGDAYPMGANFESSGSGTTDLDGHTFWLEHDKAWKGADGEWHRVPGNGETDALVFGAGDPVDGTIAIVGHRSQVDGSTLLNSGGTLTTAAPLYNSEAIFNVTAGSGFPFTYRITGTSVDETAGTTTPGDTEDIVVAATGWFKSSKKWLDDPDITIVEGGKTSTLEVWKARYWDANNQDFLVKGVRLEYVPKSAGWSITVSINHLQADGQEVVLWTVTKTSGDSPVWAEPGEKGTSKSTAIDHLVLGAGSEGIYVVLSTVKIQQVYLDVKFQT